MRPRQKRNEGKWLSNTWTHQQSPAAVGSSWADLGGRSNEEARQSRCFLDLLWYWHMGFGAAFCSKILGFLALRALCLGEIQLAPKAVWLSLHHRAILSKRPRLRQKPALAFHRFRWEVSLSLEAPFAVYCAISNCRGPEQRLSIQKPTRSATDLARDSIVCNSATRRIASHCHRHRSAVVRSLARSTHHVEQRLCKQPPAF
ncbi:hypothetical protein CONLIGDRAFT_263416 [Coniochaeta ligniaria NRRL 30616]|uniref:Uncharacterized protein n=1 Tax=Coniochaeta ligniaria NRRL 30616 TaxID=1408157 RepID=A0A1J7IY84_9PEZI|nr:hypothetical protein CONLIGDRAFT_263416 [Coniochaeta ligniaria NRRL 30616]